MTHDRLVATIGGAMTLLTAIIGATMTIETRYAKAQEVKEQLEELYSKQLKLRILELDLKAQQTPSDRALRQYLMQELNKSR